MQNNQKNRNRTTNMGDNSIFNESIAGHFIQGNYFEFGEIKTPKWLVALVEHFTLGIFIGFMAFPSSDVFKLVFGQCPEEGSCIPAIIGEIFSAILIILYCNLISKKKKGFPWIIGFSILAFLICMAIRLLVERIFGLDAGTLNDNIISYPITFGISCILFAFGTKIIDRITT